LIASPESLQPEVAGWMPFILLFHQFLSMTGRTSFR
jgi:hypothetical protein